MANRPTSFNQSLEAHHRRALMAMAEMAIITKESDVEQILHVQMERLHTMMIGTAAFECLRCGVCSLQFACHSHLRNMLRLRFLVCLVLACACANGSAGVLLSF